MKNELKPIAFTRPEASLLYGLISGKEGYSARNAASKLAKALFLPANDNIESLAFSTYTYHCLADSGINTISALIANEPSAIRKIGGVGDVTMKEITDTLYSMFIVKNDTESAGYKRWFGD